MKPNMNLITYVDNLISYTKNAIKFYKENINIQHKKITYKNLNKKNIDNNNINIEVDSLIKEIEHNISNLIDSENNSDSENENENENNILNNFNINNSKDLNYIKALKNKFSPCSFDSFIILFIFSIKPSIDKYININEDKLIFIDDRLIKINISYI